ncbi:MAG: Wzz/FepE/Etk N-terminal domain-containing protein [Ferruginibacter sp.]
MNTQELIRAVFSKIARYKILVLVTGLAFAVLLYFYSKTKQPVYTAKATVFPLTNASDNALSNSTLSGILGLGDAPKSFSSEATINIIELTLSRNVRENVAMSRLPKFNNKRIVELLVEDINAHTSFLSSKINMPSDSTQMSILGGEILKPLINAKMSKNGVLELFFSNTRKDFVTPISYAFIDQISQFYIDLKIKKALADYQFTLNKIDSLQDVVDGVDRRAISMQNSTLFTPTNRLEYNLPKENLSQDKIRVIRQRDISMNNREEAIWRLQKVTPIISVLDKPTEPFTVAKPSSLLYIITGMIVGCILAAGFLVFGLIYRFVKAEAVKSVFGETASPNA